MSLPPGYYQPDEWEPFIRRAQIVSASGSYGYALPDQDAMIGAAPTSIGARPSSVGYWGPAEGAEGEPIGTVERGAFQLWGLFSEAPDKVISTVGSGAAQTLETAEGIWDAIVDKTKQLAPDKTDIIAWLLTVAAVLGVGVGIAAGVQSLLRGR